jgi:hypothetical protein
MNFILQRSDKLKRDYKITYTWECECEIDEADYDADDEDAQQQKEEDRYFGSVDTKTVIMKDCYNTNEARGRFYEMMENDELEDEVWNFNVELISTREQVIKNEVYELVLADLFEGEIGRYEWVDTEDEEYEEPEAEADGVYKILIEHEAYNRYMNTRINNQ